MIRGSIKRTMCLAVIRAIRLCVFVVLLIPSALSHPQVAFVNCSIRSKARFLVFDVSLLPLLPICFYFIGVRAFPCSHANHLSGAVIVVALQRGSALTYLAGISPWSKGI